MHVKEPRIGTSKHLFPLPGMTAKKEDGVGFGHSVVVAVVVIASRMGNIEADVMMVARWCVGDMALLLLFLRKRILVV